MFVVGRVAKCELQLLRSTPPSLPKIKSDIIIQVFTHKSLRRTTNNPAEFGDNERLAELGRHVLDAVITLILFNLKPMLTAAAIRKRRQELLCDLNVKSWVKTYGFNSKLRCLPELRASLDKPEECRSIFFAYIGGLYDASGMGIVQNWLTMILQDEVLSIETIQTELPPSMSAETSPPPKRIKSEEMSPPPLSPIFFGAQPPASPMRHVPPHLKSMPPPPPPSHPQSHPSPHAHHAPYHIPHYPLPNPLSPAQPNLPFLPLFNQTAAQRRVTVSYDATSTGPSHACRWTVHCVVNGIPKGTGHGGSKQIAKEEAARQAFYAMGWS